MLLQSCLKFLKYVINFLNPTDHLPFNNSTLYGPFKKDKADISKLLTPADDWSVSCCISSVRHGVLYSIYGFRDSR